MIAWPDAMSGVVKLAKRSKMSIECPIPPLEVVVHGVDGLF